MADKENMTPSEIALKVQASANNARQMASEEIVNVLVRNRDDVDATALLNNATKKTVRFLPRSYNTFLGADADATSAETSKTLLQQDSAPDTFIGTEVELNMLGELDEAGFPLDRDVKALLGASISIKAGNQTTLIPVESCFNVLAPVGSASLGLEAPGFKNSARGELQMPVFTIAQGDTIEIKIVDMNAVAIGAAQAVNVTLKGYRHGAAV